MKMKRFFLRLLGVLWLLGIAIAEGISTLWIKYRRRW